MISYPSYDSLAIDLDLHYFDKISVLRNAGNAMLIDDNKYWFVVTDDGQCHLFDKRGNLDDINKLHIIREHYISKYIKKIIIPDSIIMIEYSAFYGCSRLKSATIPDTVTDIGYWAFYGCSSLTNVTIPDSVTRIGEYAFTGCSNLVSVVIGNGVTGIGLEAFYGCSRLTNVKIGNSVMNIGMSAFKDCKNLKNVFFKGKTLNQIMSIEEYPWEIKDEDVIKAELK